MAPSDRMNGPRRAGMSRMKIHVFTVAFPILLTVAGCELVGDSTIVDPARVENISFARDIQSIFDSDCVSCHGPTRSDALLRLDSWGRALSGSSTSGVIIPFDSTRSLLSRLLTDLPGDPHPVDRGGRPVSSSKVRLLKRWIQEGARNESGDLPYADSLNLVYVASTNDGSVSIIEATANVVIRRIDFQTRGFSPLSKPYDVAVEPDGSFWYVSLSGENLILKLDRSNQIAAQTSIEKPGLMEIDPVRDLLYVTRAQSDDTPPASIAVVRRSDLFVQDVDVTFSRPHALAVRPQNDYVLSASSDVDQIMIISTESRSVSLFPIQGPEQGISHFELSEDGSTLYGSSTLRNQVSFFDLSGIPVIRQLQSVSIGVQPGCLTLIPSALELVVCNPAANRLTILSSSTGAVLTTVSDASLASPSGSTLSSDGRVLYVSNANTTGTYLPRYEFVGSDVPGTVTVMDTSTKSVRKVLEVGRGARGIARR